MSNKEFKEGMLESRLDEDTGAWCWDFYESEDWDHLCGNVRKGAPWTGSFPISAVGKNAKRDGRVVELSYEDPPKYRRSYTITFASEKQAMIFTGKDHGD